MNREKSRDELIEQRAAKVKELGRLGPLIQGTLTRRESRCGTASCRCARGDKHVSHHLTRKVAGRTVSVYVPVDMVDEVSRWVEEYRHAKGLLQDISSLNEQLLRTHVAARRAGLVGRGGRQKRKTSRS